MINYIKKISFLLVISSVLSFFSLIIYTSAFAANISVSVPQTVNDGEIIEVLVRVDSDGELINSANVILDYDEDLISFAGYKSDGTVLKLWVEAPNTKNENIYFSGIVPGGVSRVYDPNAEGQSDIPLVRILFQAKKEGVAKFSFIKTEILKHDGAGTQLAHEQMGGEVSIKSNTAVTGENGLSNIDNEKPEPFEITFLNSSTIERTPPMIIFQASDKGSGIKEYKLNTGGSSWTEARSPQPVTVGIFPKNLTIRAYDYYGNYQESTIRIPGLIPAPILSLVIVLLIICSFGIYKMLKYKQ